MSDFDRRQLDSIVRGAMVGAEVPLAAGIGAAVLIGDRLEEIAVGIANPEFSFPMTTDTLVQIGSTTKVMNAALIMRLVELGLLDLDRPVCEVISGFHLADPAATRALTLRHCLSMTSGVDNGPYDDFGFDDECLSRYVAALAHIPQLFHPGAGFNYSNAGSVVAGRAAECVTGKRWDALLREHILEPAGMAHTETMTDRLLFRRFAVGVGPSGEVVRPWYWSRSMGPAGGTCASTAGDLTRLARVFLSGGRSGTGTRLLSSRTIAVMTEPAVVVPTRAWGDQWCVGPHWTDSGGRVVLGHEGGSLSGHSILWWIPELDAAIAFVTNSQAAHRVLMSCAAQIAMQLGCPTPARTELAPTELIADKGALTGVYESVNSRYEVSTDGESLYIHEQGRGVVRGQIDVMTRLLPTEGGRFLYEQPKPGSGPQLVAFSEYAGAQVIVHGVFAARFVGDDAERFEISAGRNG